MQSKEGKKHIMKKGNRREKDKNRTKSIKRARKRVRKGGLPQSLQLWRKRKRGKT